MDLGRKRLSEHLSITSFASSLIAEDRLTPVQMPRNRQRHIRQYLRPRLRHQRNQLIRRQHRRIQTEREFPLAILRIRIPASNIVPRQTRIRPMHRKPNMEECRPHDDTLHAQPPDRRRSGSQRPHETVVVHVEFRRERVEPLLEDSILADDVLVGDGKEGDGVVHDITEDVSEFEEGDVGRVESAGGVESGVAVRREGGVEMVRGDGRGTTEHEGLPSASTTSTQS